MTKRIFRTICAVAVGIFVVSALLFLTVLYDYFSDVQHSRLKTQTEFAARGVQNEGLDYLNGLEMGDCRITWIAANGSVLYDSVSDPNDMENHLEREEVSNALSNGYGESSRYSPTLTERYLYSAKRLTDGTVIRLSVAESSLITLTLGMLRPILIIFIIAVVISVLLASRLSKKIVKPLNELNLDEPLSNEDYDELSPLLHRIAAQQKQIRRQSAELKQKRLEFEALTDGMKEGIVLLDSDRKILSLNNSAASLLETDISCIGEEFMTVNRNDKISEILLKAENGQYAQTVIELKNGQFRFSASPVLPDGKVSGIVLLLLDVTEKEKSEQMRREFSANVSHELKTPLQTISGCAELLANGVVKNEDVTKFGAQISAEAQRMIRLVEDIIKLSHLDEGAVDTERETLDLYELAENVIQSLIPEAKQAGVSLTLDGEHAKIYGISQLVSGIIFNLCDNAVKYNRENGSVRVNIKREGEKTVLSVTDTGIGIPKEHCERVFERFYRVDKSRSKEIGGTGLGLSIVKHAARLHDAQIDLASVPGEGTTVTVIFKEDFSQNLST